MPKAAIISKPQKAELENILPELVVWLSENGFDYILDPESAGYLKSESEAAIERQFRAGEQANCGDGGCDTADQADFDRIVASAPSVDVGDTARGAVSLLEAKLEARSIDISALSGARLARARNAWVGRCQLEVGVMVSARIRVVMS